MKGAGLFMQQKTTTDAEQMLRDIIKAAADNSDQEAMQQASALLTTLQKHKDTLRQIFTEIPQRTFLKLPMVSCNDLFKQSTVKAKDISKLKQQSNAAELFLSMSESVRYLRT